MRQRQITSGPGSQRMQMTVGGGSHGDDGSSSRVGGADPLAAVRNLLYGWAALAAAGDRGICPLVSPGVGSGGAGTAAEPVTCPLRPAMEYELACALEQARTRGGVAMGEDTAALTRYLIAIMQGMTVIGRVHPDAVHLRGIADEALATVDRTAPVPGPRMDAPGAAAR